MTLVEKLYNEHIKSLSPAEKMQRSSALYKGVKEMLKLQVARQAHELNEDLIDIMVAEKLYLTDEVAQDLLAKLRRKRGYK